MGRRDGSLVDVFALLPWWLNLVLGAIAYGFLAHVLPHMETGNMFLRPLLKTGPTFAVLAVLIFGIAAAISFFKSISNLRQSRPLLDHVAALHWGWCLAFAIASFVAFRLLIPSMPFENAMAKSMANLGRTFAPFIAVLFLLAAVVSAFNRMQGFRLFRSSRSLDAVRGLSWREFESYVAGGFRNEGFTVTESGGGGPDDGKDLVLKKQGRTTLVQCKHWRGNVGVAQVRELAGVMATHPGTSGILVTSGNFTAEARAFAREAGIELLDGPALADRFGLASGEPAANVASEPKCPTCGANMVRRVAGKGVHKGKSFWGCSNYPGCRGMIA